MGSTVGGLAGTTNGDDIVLIVIGGTNIGEEGAGIV